MLVLLRVLSQFCLYTLLSTSMAFVAIFVLMLSKSLSSAQIPRFFFFKVLRWTWECLWCANQICALLTFVNKSNPQDNTFLPSSHFPSSLWTKYEDSALTLGTLQPVWGKSRLPASDPHSGYEFKSHRSFLAPTAQLSVAVCLNLSHFASPNRL